MKETEIYFSFLLFVAAADSSIDREEVEFIEGAMESLGVPDEIHSEISKRIEMVRNGQLLTGFDELLASIKEIENPSLIMTLIRDGFAMAGADHDVDEAELDVIKSLISYFNSDESVVNDLLTWAEESLDIKIKGEVLYETLLSKRTL